MPHCTAQRTPPVMTWSKITAYSSLRSALSNAVKSDCSYNFLQVCGQLWVHCVQGFCIREHRQPTFPTWLTILPNSAAPGALQDKFLQRRKIMKSTVSPQAQDCDSYSTAIQHLALSLLSPVGPVIPRHVMSAFGSVHVPTEVSTGPVA